MALPFSRSMRSLEDDSFRPSALVVALAAILTAAWGFWFCCADVPVYELSTTARLEAEAAAYDVESPSRGRVVGVSMLVGQEVAAGDTLVVLDTARETSRIAEGDARLSGLEARLAALAAARQAEIQTAASQMRVDRKAAEAAGARQRQATSALRVAEAAARRTGELEEQGLASPADLERDREAAEQQRSAVAAAQSELEKIRFQREQNDSAHRARLADWDRQIAALEAEREEIQAAGKRLDHEVADRVIRAPIAGRLGEIAELRPGSVVVAGERVARIIPSGELAVIARFPAASALGRVKAGQPARMRLDAFPWTHHGQVRAEVARLGTEQVSGTIRVELRVADAPQNVPLEHGLSGTVAIEVERVTPLTLVLRAVGKRLATVG
jgi:membrane fusion protein (multidrug efflux system)